MYHLYVAPRLKHCGTVCCSTDKHSFKYTGTTKVSDFGILPNFKIYTLSELVLSGCCFKKKIVKKMCVALHVWLNLIWNRRVSTVSSCYIMAMIFAASYLLQQLKYIILSFVLLKSVKRNVVIVVFI